MQTLVHTLVQQSLRVNALALSLALLRHTVMVCRAALVVVVVAAMTHAVSDRDRARGDERAGALALYLERAGVVRALSHGALAQAGDRVQLLYDAGAARHGVVFSVDGRGHVTLHMPRTPQGTSALEGARGLLPGSFVLDDAPLHERFYFVTSRAPLSVRRVLEQAGRGRKPSFSLLKQVRAPRPREVR